jgi:hypothetical protein
MMNFFKIIGKDLRTTFESIFGNLDAWDLHRSFLHSMPTVHKSIEYIENRWKFDDEDDEHRPIFIFSAGWRSGSTLLQRLVNSGSNLLIWGEPYSYSDYIRKMADALKIFSNNRPPDSFFIDYFLNQSQNVGGITEQWTACLYPNPSDLRTAHRMFFLTLFAEPAKKLGFENWGLKEVRLDFQYAIYLQWLFPQAKLLFLYRNPYEAYRSYKTFSRWYDKWPNEPVFTPKKFGTIWHNLLSGYIKHFRSVDGMLIKYEDLISDHFKFDDLNRHLNCQIDDRIIAQKITGRSGKKATNLTFLERRILSQMVEPLAEKLGYR